MDIYTLDLSRSSTIKELHDQIKEILSLPDCYGGNLDALHDILTEKTDIRIIIRNTYHVSEEIGGYIPRLINVLNACSKENPGFSYEIEEDEEEFE